MTEKPGRLPFRAWPGGIRGYFPRVALAEIFALFMVAVALAVVLPLAFLHKKEATQAAPAQPGTETAAKPVLEKRQRIVSSAPGILGLWREAAIYLVAALQAIIAGSTLLFAYAVYQTTPASVHNGEVTLNVYAQFWLGVIIASAGAALATGIFTYLRHRNYVLIAAAAQALFGGVFLVLGTWTLTVTASLIVFALCAVLVVREATLPPAPRKTARRIKPPAPVGEMAERA